MKLAIHLTVSSVFVLYNLNLIFYILVLSRCIIHSTNMNGVLNQACVSDPGLLRYLIFFSIS